MLRPAILHKEQLNRKMLEASYDPENLYLFLTSYRTFEHSFDADEWSNWQYVSVDGNNGVRGYMKCTIDRQSLYAYSLSIINFTNEAAAFGLDVREFIDRILLKFQKIRWCVCVGNPIESTYDRLCTKYNGRIVGTFKDDQRLLDGKLYDIKHYELYSQDYLKKRGIA